MIVPEDPVHRFAQRKREARLLQPPERLGLARRPIGTSGSHDDRDFVRHALIYASAVFCLFLALFVVVGPSPTRSAGSAPVTAAAIAPLIAPLQAPTDTVTAYAPPSAGAVIAGSVIYAGLPKKVWPIVTVSMDPACTTPVFNEDLVVNADGTLRNVLVYVKSGLEEVSFRPPRTTLTMDSRGCQYVPHVLGVQVGQTVNLRNCDATSVNCCVQGKLNVGLNIGQPQMGMAASTSFQVPEIAVPVKDQVHPWKSAYICVLDHPYFNVTNWAGVFRLENLPPGTYVIEAWHEKLGMRQQTVMVSECELGQLTFTY